MMNKFKSGKWLLMMAVPALLVGCQSAQRVAGSESGVQAIPRLTSAYLAVAHQRQDPHPSTRLPIRRAHQRNLKILTQQCELLLKDVESWDTDARLISKNADEQSVIRTTVASFRDSLNQLKEAASMSDTVAVRKHYNAVTASYRQLAKMTNIDQ